ncbi:hypothetical protein BDW67DRAFT_189070 [Aspergillus spinulosporus]
MLGLCLYACIVHDYPTACGKLLLQSSAQPSVGKESEAEKRERNLRLAEKITSSLWYEASQSANAHYRNEISAAVPDKARLEELEKNSLHVENSLSPLGARELYLHTTDRYDWWVDRNDPGSVSYGNQCEYDGVTTRMLNIDSAIFVKDIVGAEDEAWREDKHFSLVMDEVYEL